MLLSLLSILFYFTLDTASLAVEFHLSDIVHLVTCKLDKSMLKQYENINSICRNRTRLEHTIAFTKVTLVCIFSNFIFYGIIAWWMDLCSVLLLRNLDLEIVSNFGNYSWWKLFLYFQIAMYFANVIAVYVESVTADLGYANIRLQITEVLILQSFQLNIGDQFAKLFRTD